MNDTSPEIEQIQFEMMQKLGSAKRIELASEMYMAARESIIASLPSRLSDQDRRTALIERMYGKEFADDFFKERRK
ncbi:MAG: hypothetical protein WKF92_05815 [Pyrinomonadaceae bacterium]